MKIVTSATIFNDSVGLRISIAYSEVNDEGKIIADNKRLDRVITDKTAKTHGNGILNYAQSLIEEG